MASKLPSFSIYISGIGTGAGKSTVSLSILSWLLLEKGYQAKELAYYKPCTQCEDVQLVSKFCEDKGIPHRGIGPVVFYSGFTRKVIEGEAVSGVALLDKIEEVYHSLKTEDTKVVIVDGIGYSSVGSVVGVSNAKVAERLKLPVLLVGKKGVGDAIDSINLIITYFRYHQIPLIGALFNKVPFEEASHSYEESKNCVTKYFMDISEPPFPVFGHIPLRNQPVDHSAKEKAPVIACRLREAKTDLALSEQEREDLKGFHEAFVKYIDLSLLWKQINLA